MGQPSLQDITFAAIDSLNAGQHAVALELSSRAVVQYPQSGHLQRLVFAMASERTMVPAIMEQLKKAIEITLGYDDVENQRLFPGWFYILQKTPLFYPLLEEPFIWSRIEPVLQDKFLIEGLRNLNFLDWNLEGIFTRLRHAMLLEYFPQGLLKTKHLSFLCALAEHCFYNGYVFKLGDEETDTVSKIAPSDPVSIALIGCYKPLSDVTFDEKISAVTGFRSMVRAQVCTPREEKDVELKFGPEISGELTKSVQAMYEEDPYPRWSSINMPHVKIQDIRANILLAGCGTGQMALGFSAALPECSFTAIDISRNSLAYAARKAYQHDIDNIEFAQMDILDVNSLGKTFDYIECSGVLHHMEDPEAGWKALASCLSAGGGMQIALYSRHTRGNIDKVKEYISGKGYKPVRADIRKLRADIAALPDESPMKEILRMRDFYSTSMVRDLVFHIQERAYTLPEITAMMDRLGLAFDGFKLHEGAKMAYRARFPDDPAMTNLKNWDVFEAENPETFVGMYRIFCHKKGDEVGDAVRRIREIQA